MKTKTLWILCMLLTGFIFLQLSSCGSAEKKEQAPVTEQKTKTADKDYILQNTNEEYAPEASLTDENKAPAANQTPVPKETENIPQKIIKTADVSYQVADYEASRLKILNIVSVNKGWVTSENQTGNDYQITNDMIIRVGSDNFDKLLEELLKEAQYVDFKKINAEDVTEEFVDITARLKTKKEVMAQYQTILKQARTIHEILEVQQYIRTLQEEIESLEGRIKYLNNRASYSTVNLTFYEKNENMPVQTKTFGSRTKEALAWGWHGIVAFFIAIIYLWPFWIVLGIGLYLMVYFIRRARRKKTKKQA